MGSVDPRLPVLSVRSLTTTLYTRGGPVTAIDSIDFDVARGEIVALLGESGCGKSLTALSLMGLLDPRAASVTGGALHFNGRDLRQLDAGQLAAVRGAELAMVFQDPMASLNPVRTVGSQVAEAIVRHACGAPASKETVRARVVALFADVGITAPALRYDSYPHELSGGTCQRVMIAMALACNPQLLIADEPTTALDVTVQQQILDLLQDLRARTGMAVLLITHDLGVVAENADRVAVMYLGQIVEHAPAGQLFSAPAHPYTRGLLAAMPDIDSSGAPLTAIAGNVPDLRARPAGCGFAPRCPDADDRCRASAPPLLEWAAASDVDADVRRSVRCWKPLHQFARNTA